jgi:predicted nucleotidyltransferase
MTSVSPDSERLLNVVRSNRAVIQKVLDEYQAKNLRIFGSVAKGTANAKSDIDMLVDVDNPHIATKLVTLILSEELSKVLGVDVDVLSAKKMLPKLKALGEEELITVA